MTRTINKNNKRSASPSKEAKHAKSSKHIKESEDESEDVICLNPRPLSEVDIEDTLENDVDDSAMINSSSSNQNDTFDFLFCDFSDDDYHITKLMMQRNRNPLMSLDIKNWNSQISGEDGLISTMVSYKATSSVVRMNDVLNEENKPSELCAFISLFHLSRFNKEKSWSKSLIKFLMPKIQSSKIDLDEVGLIVSDYLLNVPTEISNQLHTSLISDLEWAQANTSELDLPQDAYNFKHFLMFVGTDAKDSTIFLKTSDDLLSNYATEKIIFTEEITLFIFERESYLKAVKKLR